MSSIGYVIIYLFFHFVLFLPNVLGKEMDCVVEAHHPTPEQWLPKRSCCAWFKSIDTKGQEFIGKIPPALFPAFTMWGNASLSEWIFNDRYLGSTAMVSNWNVEYINTYIEYVKNGHPRENYGGATNIFLKTLNKYNIKGLRGAVVGSETPWVSSVVLLHHYNVVLLYHIFFLIFLFFYVMERHNIYVIQRHNIAIGRSVFTCKWSYTYNNY